MDLSRHRTNLFLFLYLVARGLLLPLPLEESYRGEGISEKLLVRRGFDAPRIGDQIIGAVVDGHRTSAQVDSVEMAETPSRIAENQVSPTVLEDSGKPGSEQFSTQNPLTANQLKSEEQGPGSRGEIGGRTITHLETAPPLRISKLPLIPPLRLKIPAEGLLKAFFGTVDASVKSQLKLTLFLVCLKLKKFQIYDGSTHLWYEWKALRKHKPYHPAPMTIKTFFNPFAMGDSD